MAVDLRGRRDLRLGELVLLRPVRGRARWPVGWRAARGGALPGAPGCGARRPRGPALRARASSPLRAGRRRRGARRSPRAGRASAPGPDGNPDVHDRPAHGEGLRRRAVSGARRRGPAPGSTSPTCRYVVPGGLLDAEAERRGTSAYVPGAVEPMLPHALSSEACSLMPGVERRAVTVEVDLAGRAAAGRLVLPQPDPLGRAPRIRSRWTASSPGGKGRRRQSPSRLRWPASWPRTCVPPASAGRPGGRELGAGLRVGREGQVVAAHDEIQTESHWVIEHPMILANEQVAQRLESARVPTMFRVHEQPDPAAIERLAAQLESLDVPTPPIPKAMAPGDATRLSGEISRRVIEYHRATGRGGRVFTRSCCGPQAGLLLDRESRPCGAREPELLPLHLADPALSRPRRPSWAAGDPGRRRTASGGRPGRGRGVVQRHGARGRGGRARGGRHLLRLPGGAHPLRARLGGGVRGAR